MVRHEFSAENYSLEKTLLSGQAFRWKKVGSKFVGVVEGNVIELFQTNCKLVAVVKYGTISKNEFSNYLDLNLDYPFVLGEVSKDPIVKSSVKKFSGYRILKQYPFETLISFICSTNSNVLRIRRNIENLSKLFGEKIYGQYYKFPSADVLASLKEDEIMRAGVGYRGKYIIETSKILLNGNLLNDVEKFSDEKAVEKLTALPGVGRKVADCVLLFSYHRLNRVPIDVWMKRILVNLYGRKNNAKYQDLENFSEKCFGKYAGYAAHFLFEDARKGGLF